MEHRIFNKNEYFVTTDLKRTFRAQFECIFTVCLYKKFRIPKCRKC